MRYDRQIPIIGQAGQRKLSETSVLVAGLGGLGCGVVTQLAMAGVGRLALVDYDVPSETNLNRQFIYNDPDDKRPKVCQAAEWIDRLNHDVEVDAIIGKIGCQDVSDAIDGCDLIVDCLDSYESRIELNRIALAQSKTIIHGGVDSLHGQVTVMIPGTTPCLECIMPKGGDGVTPSIGSMVSAIASIQATEAIKVITGVGEALAGKLLLIDAETWDVSVVDVSRNPSCCACGGR